MKPELKPYQLPDRSGPLSKLSKFSLIRSFGRTFRQFQSAKEATSQKIISDWPEVQPSLKFPDNLDAFQEDIYIPDTELARTLDHKHQVFVQSDPENPDKPGILFAGSSVKPEDIRQPDTRSSCYLLSALASFAASPVGSDVLMKNICPFSQGFAIVTLGYVPANSCIAYSLCLQGYRRAL